MFRRYNDTHFAISLVADFCATWKIQQAFTSVEHPHTNGQAKVANKVIPNGLKIRLNGTKGIWAKELPIFLWSYHTTPQSSTRETPFKLPYGSDTLIPVEILEPSLHRALTEDVPDEEELRTILDLLDEVWELAKIKEKAVKQRTTRKNNSKVSPRSFRPSDLVLQQSIRINATTKLSPNREEPFHVKEIIEKRAFKLEHLDGKKIPRS